MRKAVLTTFVGLAMSGILAGCSPSYQPSNTTANVQGTLVSPSTWTTVLQGAQAGQAANEYMIKTNVSLIQGSLHSTFSIYGAINVPDKAQLGFVEGTDYVNYYQQGQSAYYMDNGHWTQTQAIQRIDVFGSYVSLIQTAMQQQVSLMQLPKAYVVDEYCDVYRATVPSAVADAPEALMANVVPKQTSDVQYTFYIGQKSHDLREVDTVSVSGVHHVGSMQTNSTTILFDINQDVAKVKLPKDLIKQLENATT